MDRVEGLGQVSYVLGLRQACTHSFFLFLGPCRPGWSGWEGRQAWLEGERMGTLSLLFPPPRAKVNGTPMKETESPPPHPCLPSTCSWPHPPSLMAPEALVPWFFW